MKSIFFRNSLLSAVHSSAEECTALSKEFLKKIDFILAST